MASSIHAFSNEILDRIFSLLSEDKQAIGACRLTCRLFQELSSPYLITRLVFARRLKTTARFCEIVEHDCFCKHVTELICDFSCYCADYATNYDRYSQACLNAPQILSNPEWERRKLEDQAVWRKVKRFKNGKTRTTSADMHLANRDRDVRPDGAWLVHDEHGHDEFSESEDDHESSDESGRSNEELIMDDHLHLHDAQNDLGCYKSFADYQALYVAERQIRQKGTVEQILLRALSRLKKLKTFIITDWRGLAKPDESYGDCAQRLFGNTLAPNLISSSSVETSMFFNKLMRTIKQSENARIERLLIGSHIFEDESQEHNDPKAPMYIETYAVQYMSDVISRLRQLRLSLHIIPGLSNHMPKALEDKISQVLAKASNLERLTLAIRFETLNDIGQGIRVFSSWLAHQYYPHLNTLEFRGWILPQRLLQNFLARHTSTLRAIHFINCHLVGNQVSLAEWAGQALNIEGIEIALNPGTDVYILVYRADGTMEDVPVDTALLPENEALWLAGRENRIVRKPYNGRRPRDSPLPWVPWYRRKPGGQN